MKKLLAVAAVGAAAALLVGLVVVVGFVNESSEATLVAADPNSGESGGTVSTEPIERAGEAGTSDGFLVTTPDDTADADPGDSRCADENDQCSLRAAVQEANAADGDEPATILLGSGRIYTLALAGSGEDASATGDLDVAATIRLVGNGSTVDARGLDRAFHVGESASLTLENVTVQNGFVTGDNGGAISSAGTLTLDQADIAASTADGEGASGGAVFNDGGVLNVTDSMLHGNSANRAGGAIEAAGGETYVTRSSLTSNRAGSEPGNGGALHITGDGEVAIDSSTINDNTATREGGGLWNSTGTMTVRGSHIFGNTAEGDASDDGGGGLFNDGGTVIVETSTITGNEATGESGSGGGFFNNDGSLAILRSTIDGNLSVRAGGGIESLGGVVGLERVDLSRNSTGDNPGNGGGLHITGEGSVLVERSTVSFNTAGREGGGLWNSVGTMTVTGSDIVGNQARGDEADDGGGGLFNDGGTLVVEASTITGNDASGASGSGGGFFNNDGDLTIARSTIAGNVAVRAGGGIETVSGSVDLDQVDLSRNSSGDNPGNGGGLHTSSAGQVTIDQSTIIGNSAGNEGGGVWNSQTCTMTVTNTTFEGNTAPAGPDAFNVGGTFTIDGTGVPVG